MTALLWLGGVLGTLVVIALGLRALGASRWAELIHTHTSQLEQGRVNVQSLVQGGQPSQARFDARYHVSELEGLPAPVQRYFGAVLTDGQPIIAAASIEMAGTINMSATAEQWKPFTSMQRVVTASAGAHSGFMWDARVAMLPGMKMHVLDACIAGKGVLRAAVLGSFSVADMSGEGEMVRGEFMRFFAETPWYPTAPKTL